MPGIGEEEWPKLNSLKSKKKKKNQVLQSLTDEDLDELKGCLDLGFGFSYEEIPELCNTLPAKVSSNELQPQCVTKAPTEAWARTRGWAALRTAQHVNLGNLFAAQSSCLCFW
ncbi:hypothetical protein L3X38_043409 [Prunus dulcis]|uniref:Uncharacterized protein n=1 Tax=Prunus dulcis TaxID=3755 RepID=A0AAD4UXQ3_PRUDU|nr:hypothetical protein L3X38_043409 [Prunus dulcis]